MTEGPVPSLCHHGSKSLNCKTCEMQCWLWSATHTWANPAYLNAPWGSYFRALRTTAAEKTLSVLSSCSLRLAALLQLPLALASVALTAQGEFAQASLSAPWHDKSLGELTTPACHAGLGTPDQPRDPSFKVCKTTLEKHCVAGWSYNYLPLPWPTTTMQHF